MNIITEFYKRFDREGGKAESVFTPCVVTLLGSDTIPRLPAVSLSLSFGVKCAYRLRKDDRILLGYTDTNVVESVNKLYINNLGGAEHAKDIIKSIASLPAEIKGAELLLHTECELAEFAPAKLCALKACSELFGIKDAIRSIIKISASLPSYVISLIPENRFSVVNNLTLDYISYPFNFDGYKIICVNTGKKSSIEVSDAFINREKSRINAASVAISENSIENLGQIMADSGRDYLDKASDSLCDFIFREACEIAGFARPFCDLSGVIAIVQDGKCDEFVKVIGLKHQKKTGKKPAFYISD